LGDRHQQNGVNYTLDLNTDLTQVLADGTNTYLYGNGRIAQADSTTEYFLGDALGSVRQLTDPASAVTLTQSYAPYGEVTQSVGTSQTSYAFTGETRDENGLTFLRARYLDSNTGRFTQRDPSRLEANLYLYAQANPVNRIDPTGLFSDSQIAYSLGEPEGDFEYNLNWFDRQGDERWGFLALLMDAEDGDTITGVSLEKYGEVSTYPLGQLYSIGGCSIAILGSGSFFIPDYIRDLPSIAKQKGRLDIPPWRSVVQRYQLDGKGSYQDTHYTDLPDFYVASIGLELNVKYGGTIQYLHIQDRFGNNYNGVNLAASVGLSRTLNEYQEGYYLPSNQGFTRTSSESELISKITGVSFPVFGYGFLIRKGGSANINLRRGVVVTYNEAMWDFISLGIGGSFVWRAEGTGSEGWNHLNKIRGYDRVSVIYSRLYGIR